MINNLRYIFNLRSDRDNVFSVYAKRYACIYSSLIIIRDANLSVSLSTHRIPLFSHKFKTYREYVAFARRVKRKRKASGRFHGCPTDKGPSVAVIAESVPCWIPSVLWGTIEQKGVSSLHAPSFPRGYYRSMMRPPWNLPKELSESRRQVSPVLSRSPYLSLPLAGDSSFRPNDSHPDC